MCHKNNYNQSQMKSKIAMPNNDDEQLTFKTPEEKIKYLEDMLIDLLKTEVREIGRIASDGEKFEGSTFFRVTPSGSGNDMISVLPEGIQGVRAKDLKIGTPVMLIKGKIVGILPETLNPKVEAPVYKLNTWDDIGGMKDQVNRIRDAVELPLKHPEMYRKMGIEPLRGVLMSGLPGNGKTTIAKAIASTILGKTDVGVDAFIYIKGAELLSPLVGVAEKSIKDIFERCRKHYRETKQRSILFIDEAEAILPIRGRNRSTDVFSTIVPTFLSEMDGFDDHSPFVILATNRPEMLDPAVTREGRIDLKVEILPPTKDDFLDIMQIHLRKTTCLDSVDVLATRATNLIFSRIPERVSGSLSQAVVKFATQSAIKETVAGSRKKVGILEHDIDYAIDQLATSIACPS